MSYRVECEFCGSSVDLDGGPICCVEQAVKLHKRLGSDEAEIRRRWNERTTKTLPRGTATVPLGFKLEVGPNVSRRSVFGIPIELSMNASRDSIVMHPDVWSEFMANAIKLIKVDTPTT